MTPRERAIDLRKNLARIGILLDEERAINMIEQAFVVALADANETDKVLRLETALDSETKRSESLLVALKERTTERDAAEEQCASAERELNEEGKEHDLTLRNLDRCMTERDAEKARADAAETALRKIMDALSDGERDKPLRLQAAYQVAKAALAPAANPHIGSRFVDFLKEEGIKEEVDAKTAATTDPVKP